EVKKQYTENYVIMIRKNNNEILAKKNHTNCMDNYETFEELKEYRKSTLFLLLAVDNKLANKYENWLIKNEAKSKKDSENFKQFMKKNDDWWNNDKNHKIMSIADHIVKSEKELDNIMNKYSELTASRTNCMSRKVGCVLVKNGYRVIATGYNGTPTGIKHCIEGNCKSCSGENKEYCKCIHAEENALMIAGMEAEGCTLYCTTRYKDLDEVKELFKEADEIKKEAKRKIDEADEVKKEAKRKIDEADEAKKEAKRKIDEADKAKKEAKRKIDKADEADETKKEAKRKIDEADETKKKAKCEINEADKAKKEAKREIDEADKAKKEAKRKIKEKKVEDNTLERLEANLLPPKKFMLYPLNL
ncbi:8589_t:CDS:2, partial [Cetraspora pellucida]